MISYDHLHSSVGTCACAPIMVRLLLNDDADDTSKIDRLRHNRTSIFPKKWKPGVDVTIIIGLGSFESMMWCPSSLFLAVLCVLYFEPVVGTRSISTRHSTSTLWHSAVLHILRVSYSPRKCNCIQTHCVDNTSIQSWHPSTVLPKTLLIVFRNNIKERRKKKVPLTQMEHMYY